MPDVSFTNLLVVAVVAVLAPLAVGYAPRLRIPAVVLEIIGGIIIGPSGLGWVKPDLPVSILALVGLAFLLFLSGLEIDLDARDRDALLSQKNAHAARARGPIGIVELHAAIAGSRPPETPPTSEKIYISTPAGANCRRRTEQP